MKRKALGKGLSSLIPNKPPRAIPRPTEPEPTTDQGLRQIDLDRIRPNPGQPRQEFDQVQLEELAQSLQQEGVLQPIIVRSNAQGGFDLVAGERRWRAAQIAGLLKIPAVIMDVGDDKMLQIALIENLQRESLNPLEQAAAYQSLIDDFDLTQQEIADRVGKQRATVANALRLLNLTPQVQEMIRARRITAGHAKALAAVTSRRDQIELAKRIEKHGLSVRQAEAVARRLARTSTASASRTRVSRDPNVEAAEDSLQKALGTKVRIVQGKKGGRLEIYFFSEEELERVYQVVFEAARGTGKAPASH